MTAPSSSPSRHAPQVATLGPWSATRSDPNHGADVWHITACPAPNQEKDICDVPGGPHQEANAHLIAAAPAMRDALQACEKAITASLAARGFKPDYANWSDHPEVCAEGEALVVARSALALAQGAAPYGGANSEGRP